MIQSASGLGSVWVTAQAPYKPLGNHASCSSDSPSPHLPTPPTPPTPPTLPSLSLLPTPYSLLPTQGCQSTISPIGSHLI
ncbi:hypothetical protein [Moorena producens]|uniref:hypothetical protein n=1 Tax=Moorena producens TaxID=1155739 RepID=UPI00131428A1|nr:hypothetical protein [Moorena producens]